jgi:hypothetical protein
VQTNKLVLKVDHLCTFSYTPGILCTSSIHACVKTRFFILCGYLTYYAMTSFFVFTFLYLHFLYLRLSY